MTRAERHAILGPANLARIKRLVAAATPPTPELLDELCRVFAPVVADLHREAAAQQASAAA
jgi:hypothetical protein